MTTLETFAAQHRLRITRDAYNTRIIKGRGGSLITDYGDGRLSVLVMCPTAKSWCYCRRALFDAGCRLEQNGDREGSLSFDPTNATACALAIKAAGIKRRRIPSDAQRAVITANLEKMSRERAVRAPKTDDLASKATT